MRVLLPPYAFAILTAYLHECCQLCGQTVSIKPKSDFRGVLNHAPLLCHHCHHQWVRELPTFVIGANDNNDKKQLPLYTSSYYEKPLSQVMTAFKDKGEVSSLMVLYHLLRFTRPPLGLEGNHAVLIPTPTTKGRLLERGFNPVLILAKYLSFLWQIPIWQGVSRMDNAVHQRGLGRSDRLQNVKHDFYLTDTLSTRQVILMDDVVTTGSTLGAMAEVIWSEYPHTKIHAVCVLHGREDIHLPIKTDIG